LRYHLTQPTGYNIYHNLKSSTIEKCHLPLLSPLPQGNYQENNIYFIVAALVLLAEVKIAICILTGDFPRDFVGEPWNCVLRNDPVPIRQRNSSIPEKLAEVIDLALVEKPKIYFQTADEFKAALLKCV
jgi:hypothetical protein